MRETGPVFKRLRARGSEQALPLARKLLGQLKARMRFLDLDALRWPPRRMDGYLIGVRSSYGQDFVSIAAPGPGAGEPPWPLVYSGLCVWNPSLWVDDPESYPGVDGSRYFGRRPEQGQYRLPNYCAVDHLDGWDPVPVDLDAVSSYASNDLLELLAAIEADPGHIDLRASGKFTGKMRQVVQLLAGYGQRIPWRYHFDISHGIYTDAQGGDWVVEISKENGVRVQKLEYRDFPRDDCPTTASIPVPASEWHSVLDAPALNDFYSRSSFYRSQGWSFDYDDGGTARNTCFDYIFTGQGTEGNWRSYMYELTIAGGGDPDEPVFSASLSLVEDELFYVFYTLGADPPVPAYGSYFFPAITERAPPLDPWWPGELYDQQLPELGEYDAPFFVYHNGDDWEVGYWHTLITEDPEPSDVLPQRVCHVPVRSQDYGKTYVVWGAGTTVASVAGPKQGGLNLQPKAVHYFTTRSTYRYWMEAVGAHLLSVSVGGLTDGYVSDRGLAQKLYWAKLTEEDGTFSMSTNIAVPGGDRETMFGMSVKTSAPAAEGTLSGGWKMGAIQVAGQYGSKQFLSGDCVDAGSVSLTGGCASDRYFWTYGGAPHPSDPTIDMDIACTSWWIGDACLGKYCQCFSWQRQLYSPLGYCGLCRYAITHDDEPVEPEEITERELHMIASHGISEAVEVGSPTVPDNAMGYATMLRDAFEPGDRWLAYLGQEAIITPGGSDAYVAAFQEQYPDWEDLYGIRANFVGRP